MLALTRKKDEAIMILVPQLDGTTEKVRILVTKVDANRVILGIDAQPHIKIYRSETTMKDPSYLDSLSQTLRGFFSKIHAAAKVTQGKVSLAEETNEEGTDFTIHVSKNP